MSKNSATILAAFIIAVLGAATALYIHFADNGDNAEGAVSVVSDKVVEDDEEVKRTPSINLAEVFVTPIETKLPSTFYAEISNTGSDVAMNFNIAIDFGEALPESCEWVPNSIAKGNEPENSAVQIIAVSQLQSKQSLYVVCSLNIPFFKKITVDGGNVGYAKSLDYETYKNQRLNDGISFYKALWRVFLVIFLFAIFVPISVRIYNFISGE